MVLAGGLTLGDLDLGGSDAESDTRLSEYFIQTPYAEEAVRGRRRIFLGRKGSGKSGLCRILPIISGASSLVRILTPDDYSWATLEEAASGSMLPEQAHTQTWRRTLAIALASAILCSERAWYGADAQLVANLRQLLIEPGNETISPSYSGFFRSLLEVHVSAFGFGLGVARDANKNPEKRPLETQAILHQVDMITQTTGVTIAIDQLDDSWDGSEESKALLIGLLKAAKELNNQYGSPTPGRGVRILVFLRTEIYDSLEFDDKDKHRNLEHRITWDRTLLEEMIQRRLPRGTHLNDLFEAGRMDGSSSALTYIIRRTFLRPREVLQFLEECIGESGKSSLVITRSAIRRAEQRYSRWKLEDLKQEFRRVYPLLDPALGALRGGPARYDDPSSLLCVLHDAIPQHTTVNEGEALIEMLFETSVLGIRPHTKGAIQFKSAVPDLLHQTEGAVYIHPSLHCALRLR